jgi:hypothetical protein
LPLPEVVPVNVVQPMLLAAVHAHPALAVTFTWPVPPPAGSDSDVGLTVYVQDVITGGAATVAAATVTLTRCPATVIVPVR